MNVGDYLLSIFQNPLKMVVSRSPDKKSGHAIVNVVRDFDPEICIGQFENSLISEGYTTIVREQDPKNTSRYYFYFSKDVSLGGKNA